MPIIAAFSVGATSAQVQAWFLVAIASSLLHSTGAQQEMLFVVDRWNHRIMSWEVGGNAGKAVAGSASGGGVRPEPETVEQPRWSRHC